MYQLTIEPRQPNKNYSNRTNQPINVGSRLVGGAKLIKPAQRKNIFAFMALTNKASCALIGHGPPEGQINKIMLGQVKNLPSFL